MDKKEMNKANTYLQSRTGIKDIMQLSGRRCVVKKEFYAQMTFQPEGFAHHVGCQIKIKRGQIIKINPFDVEALSPIGYSNIISFKILSLGILIKNESSFKVDKLEGIIRAITKVRRKKLR